MEIRVKFEKSGEKKVVGVKDVRDVNAPENGITGLKLDGLLLHCRAL